MLPNNPALQLKFRDPARVRALAQVLERETRAIGRSPVAVMHVCGSHEQAIARFGLRALFPKELQVIMGPGCPVCVTDMPEIDEAVALVQQGVHLTTYGDMLKVPGTVKSLADAQAAGGRVNVVYSVEQAIEMAQQHPSEEVVFFASGFETTAVTTAAVLCRGVPQNFSVLSVHKYVPPAMEVVAAMPNQQIEGFLAAGHAAAITGWGVFEPFVVRHQLPVVVAGFEPLDILAALVKLIELVKGKRAEVVNMYPRLVTREGNRSAQDKLWKVFRTVGGRWRGITDIPDGNLRLRDEWAHVDARRRFQIGAEALREGAPSALVQKCLCGSIMIGLHSPTDCELFGKECVPDSPVGACMVSSEGACKIWHQYGGMPDLKSIGSP